MPRDLPPLSSLSLSALCALTLLPACFAEGEYGYDGPGDGVVVGVAPPPARYEVPRACGYNATFVPGHWDWSGTWRWRTGRCVRVRQNAVFVQPYYSPGDRRYYRGHWSTPGGPRGPRGGVGPHHDGPGSYVPPPAPAIR